MIKILISKIFHILKKLIGIIQRELACFLLKKTYNLISFGPKYLAKFFPFLNVDDTLLTCLENAVCLNEISVSKYEIKCPINSLNASNPSCFKVEKNIYVLYTIHNHSNTASRRFSYTDKTNTSRIGFGLSVITPDGLQQNLGTANLDKKQKDLTICDFRCISLQNSILVSCSVEIEDTHRIGWCLIPFNKLKKGPAQWIFCIENSPFEYRTEKNWVPVSCGGDKFKFIYRPEEKNNCSEFFLKKNNQSQILIHPKSRRFSNKSGGSPFLKINEINFALVHHTYFKPYRNYLHFFALGKWVLKDKFEISILEKSFFFFEPFDTEYCSGICEIDEHIFFSFGFRNSQAWLMKIKREVLLEIINSNLKKQI